MATFSEAKAALTEIAAKNRANLMRDNGAKAALAATVLACADMVTQYGPMVTAIDAALAADPTNQAWLNAQAEMGLLVADFLAEQARATAMKTAVAAL